MLSDMKSVLKEIEKTRRELVELGNKKTFLDPDMLKKSQILDNLINQYYQLNKMSYAKRKAS